MLPASGLGNITRPQRAAAGGANGRVAPGVQALQVLCAKRAGRPPLRRDELGGLATAPAAFPRNR
jgi:hypothetical protein